MMFLSWISTVWADVQVTHTITEHTIKGQPIYVDLLLLNPDTKPVEIQDILNDRWQITFTLTHDGQKHTLRSQRPSEVQPKSRTLQSREVLELHLELPNSKALKPGTYSLGIDFPLDNERKIETGFVVHKQTPQWADFDLFNYEVFLDESDLLWTQPHKDNHLLFEGTINPRWIQSIPVATAQNTIHIGATHHTYWKDRSRITVLKRSGDRTQTPQELSIPWKEFDIVGRGVTDLEGQVFIPIWVPNPNGTGTLYSVQPQSNNTITFRKIRTGKRPQSIDIALTQASTPLFLLQYTSALELYSLTTVGEERIDKLPPKSVTIPTQSAESPWNHATFLVSEQSGLHIAAVGGKDATHTIHTFGLSGNAIESYTIKIDTNVQTIHTVGISDEQPFAVLQSNDKMYYWSKQSGVTAVPAPTNGVVNQRQSPPVLWSMQQHQFEQTPMMKQKK